MSFLFTIEQIELVRRLRKTGLSKEQVWRAYEEMDRLESELNGCESAANSSLTNRNSSVPNVMKPSMNITTITNANTSQILPQNEFQTNPNHESCSKSPTLSLTSNKSNSQSFQTQLNSYSLNSMDKSSNALPFLNQSFNTSQIDMSDDESVKESSVTIIPIPVAQTDTSSQSMSLTQRQQMSVYYSSEEPMELIEFKKKGETVMLNEIRSFVNKYNIRQIMIAEMTKISQGYVSRFFRGEGQDMSEKSKNLIYLWYISCRNKPEILAQYCPQTIGERRTQLTDAGDLLPIRRDRFIFRREHLLVLDQYFKENPYPDASTKEIIAEECNASVERITKRLLKERDKVTVSVVSNWFNNKRKEAKNKRLPQNQSIGAPETTHSFSNHSLPYVTETSIYSNHSNTSVEELETRPDLSILTDFEGHESIDLSDDDSHHSYTIDQTNNYINKEMKPNFVIKLEPTY